MALTTAAQRAIRERLKNRRLPDFEPSSGDPSVTQALRSIQEHLRMYEGQGGAPKERFVTLAELENAGLLKADVKQGFGYISRVLNKDVAQEAGSTANPTLKDPVRTDTTRQPRTPGGGGGASVATQQDSTQNQAKLNDLVDLNVAKPTQSEALIYDGGKWSGTNIFAKQNRWTGQQSFDKPLSLLELASTPAAPLEGRGLLYAKSDGNLYYQDEAGTETNLLGATGNFVEYGTLTQADSYVLLNRTDATNPPFYVVQAGAGSIFRMGVGTIGSTTFTGAKFEMLNDGQLLLDAAAGEMFTLKNRDHAGGDTYNAWIQFDDAVDARQAFIGFGSSGNQDFYIWNDAPGDIRFDSSLFVGDGATKITIDAAAPKLAWVENDAAADTQLWDAVAENGILRFRTRTDVDGNGTDWLQVTRSSNLVTSIDFGHEVTGVSSANVGSFNGPGAGNTLLKSGNYAAMGSHYSSERTWLGNNVYVDGADAVSGQMRTAVSHASYGHTVFEMAAGSFYWYGDSANVTSGAIVTKQQLMRLYETGELEIVQNASAAAPALSAQNVGTANLIAEFVGDSDSLEIATISAGDYTIRNSGQNNYITFYDGSGGVDIGYNGSLRIECDSGNDVSLCYAGTEMFKTQDNDAAGKTSGAQVKDHLGNLRDVAFAVMPRFHTNTNLTLTDNDAYGYWYSNNATTYTITLNNSSGGGLDFPIGGTMFFLNYGTGSVTVNTGTGTLYSPQLGTSTTGSYSIGGNSVATILKYGADIWFLWGDDIS